jgi:hypothetical protein
VSYPKRYDIVPNLDFSKHQTSNIKHQTFTRIGYLWVFITRIGYLWVFITLNGHFCPQMGIPNYLLFMLQVVNFSDWSTFLTGQLF